MNYGYTSAIDRTDSVTFTSDVTEIIFVMDRSPDIEGIIFVDEDGTHHRIGQDNTYVPANSVSVPLNGKRFIGFSAKFHDFTAPYDMTES